MSSKFTFIEDLGSGTYGRVVRVKEDDQELALKIYSRRQSGIYSSLKEVDILFRLKHPHLIKGHKLCTKKQDSKIFKDDLTGSLQELMDGSIHNFEINLSEELEADSKKRHLFYFKLAEKLLFSLLSASEALNKAAYIHLDIKPENILYKAKNIINDIDDIEFFLGDYGLCIPRDDYQREQLIKGPWDAGTYLYLPPEALSEDTFVSENSSLWMIALSVIEFLTTESHHEYINYNENDKYIINSVKNLAPETRQKTLSKLESFYNKKSYSPELEATYKNLHSILSPMLFINHRKRTKPSNLPFGEIKELKLNLKQSNDFIKSTFKTFLELISEDEYKLREVTMAWTLACKMMSLNRISEKADIENELCKCLEFATIFYRDMSSSDLYFLKPEKKLVNYINEIKGNIFDNDLYIKSGSVEEINNILKSIILNTDDFRDKLVNGFEITETKHKKNVTFQPSQFLALY